MHKLIFSIVAALSFNTSLIVAQNNIFRSSKKQKSETESPTPVLTHQDIKVLPRKTVDRTTPDKTIDILHMDLSVRFDFDNHNCYGKQTLQLTSYFYPTDTIVLDAKNMVFSGLDIVDLQGRQWLFLTDYDKKTLRIKLEKKLSRADTLLVTISYIAMPDLQEKGGSKAIRDQKGLYFMNTDYSEPHKPIQLWTQGETESNSCWFPFIDKPHEKFTSKLTILIPDSMTTLSNGLLTSSHKSGNMRTDVWENDLPMSGYLTMMAIGNFKISSETWRDINVDYYLEPSYAPFASGIFKHTTEMLEFFSQRLGVLYPWQKYAQVVVRDFVSGAMENTSATLHGDFVQKNARELIDNHNDGIIAHELFHQWFGDLVTCESWSHLVINEGFAAYGEQLWFENKYGKDAGLKYAHNSLNRYLRYMDNNNGHPIVDFAYRDKEDMFSPVTYQKGARVLNLLRAELGDDAFFKSLQTFLVQHSFQAAQIDDLRRAVENTTGRDLRPFFHQWFLRNGHPRIEIKYTYIDSNDLLRVDVRQLQKNDFDLFSFPLTFRVTQGLESRSYKFQIDKEHEHFFVKKINPEDKQRIDVFVDPDATFLGEIIDQKPFFNHILTYNRAVSYIEKIRSLQAMKDLQNNNDSVRFTLLSAINDSDEDIRHKALEWIDWTNQNNINAVAEILENIAKSDPSPQVKAKAIGILHRFSNPKYLPMMMILSFDSSYSVAGKALQCVHTLAPDEAYRIAQQIKNDVKGELLEACLLIFSKNGNENDISFFENQLMMCFKSQRAKVMEHYVNLIIKLDNESYTNNALLLLKERAQKDSNPKVRATAITLIDLIRKNYIQVAKTSNDGDLILLYKQNASNIESTLTEIIQNEQDVEVINLLKIDGVKK